MLQLLLVLAHVLLEIFLVSCLFSGAFVVYIVAGTKIKERRQDRAIFKFVKEARRDFF